MSFRYNLIDKPSIVLSSTLGFFIKIHRINLFSGKLRSNVRIFTKVKF